MTEDTNDRLGQIGPRAPRIDFDRGLLLIGHFVFICTCAAVIPYTTILVLYELVH